MAILVEYPLLAAAVGILLIGLGRRAHRELATGAGVAWLLYGSTNSGGLLFVAQVVT